MNFKRAAVAAALCLAGMPLVAGTQPFHDPASGDSSDYRVLFADGALEASLSFQGRDFNLQVNDRSLSGQYYRFRDLLLLWDGNARAYQLVSLQQTSDGEWLSCWGKRPRSVSACDENAHQAEMVAVDAADMDPEMEPAAAPVEGGDGMSEPVGGEPAEPVEEGDGMSEPVGGEPAEPVEEGDGMSEPVAGEPAEPVEEAEPEAPEPVASVDDMPEPAEPAPEPAPEPAAEPAPAPAPEPAQEPEPEPVAEAAPGAIDEVRCDAPTAELKAAILAATNRTRAAARQCGNTGFDAAQSLTWNDTLAAAAEGHSRDMAGNNFFSHTGSDGLSLGDRARNAGYSFRSVGENIAAGMSNVGTVQQGWEDSPGHCQNLMNQSFTEMGAACVVDSDASFSSYWTVVLGTQ